MPIVFVCDTRLQIVWADGNFCEVLDCERHPALGTGLYDFLQVPEGHAFRKEVPRLNVDLKRASYTTQFTSADQKQVAFDFYLEHIPSFDGIEGASLIAVGVQHGTATQETLITQQAEDTQDGSDDDELRRTYRYSNLRYGDGKALFARLEDLIDSTEAYRQSSFTLEEAASQLNSNVLYVSQVTNYFAGVSFPNYLNQKRCDKLRELVLSSDGEADFNEQYKAAGFGSYSGLNRFLRNRYEVSPMEFLRGLKGDGLGDEE